MIAIGFNLISSPSRSVLCPVKHSVVIGFRSLDSVSMNFLRFVAHFSNGQLVSEEKTLKMAYSSSQFISAAHWIDFDLIVVYCRLLDSFPVVRLLENWSTSLVAFDASFSISKTFSLVSVWARRVCFSILLCEYWNMNWITELVTGKNVLHGMASKCLCFV